MESLLKPIIEFLTRLLSHVATLEEQRKFTIYHQILLLLALLGFLAAVLFVPEIDSTFGRIAQIFGLALGLIGFLITLLVLYSLHNLKEFSGDSSSNELLVSTGFFLHVPEDAEMPVPGAKLRFPALHGDQEHIANECGIAVLSYPYHYAGRKAMLMVEPPSGGEIRKKEIILEAHGIVYIAVGNPVPKIETPSEGVQICHIEPTSTLYVCIPEELAHAYGISAVTAWSSKGSGLRYCIMLVNKGALGGLVTGFEIEVLDYRSDHLENFRFPVGAPYSSLKFSVTLKPKIGIYPCKCKTPPYDSIKLDPGEVGQVFVDIRVSKPGSYRIQLYWKGLDSDQYFRRAAFADPEWLYFYDPKKIQPDFRAAASLGSSNTWDFGLQDVNNST